MAQLLVKSGLSWHSKADYAQGKLSLAGKVPTQHETSKLGGGGESENINNLDPTMVIGHVYLNDRKSGFNSFHLYISGWKLHEVNRWISSIVKSLVPYATAIRWE